MHFPSILLLTLLITAIIAPFSEGFSPVKQCSSSSPSTTNSITTNSGNRRIPHRLVSTAASSSSSSDDKDDILKPKYEIEPMPLRIGHGFDIHRMAPIGDAGQPIVIAGVTIDHVDQKWTDADGKYVPAGEIFTTQLGVVAHSDGDVIYHCIVDAIFGALTLPDIGQVFQDNDPRWKGCDSSRFMEHAYEVMTGHGYEIGNVDVTLILEKPKVADFKPAMKENILGLLRTTPGKVNIKARTHERVDSMGELRSLSCHVVLTLVRK